MAGTLTLTISGTPVTVLEGSLKMQDSLDQASTLSFMLHDDMGAATYQPGQQVTLTDSINGLIFSGYIHTATKVNLTPNDDNTIAIDCVDQHYLADRTYSRKDYQDQDAGDIAADLLSNYLVGSGVMAAYAVRRDATAVQLALGTTSNVVGATTLGDGDLELKAAGSIVTVSETTTADFSTGTLTNTVASNNALGLTTVQALQMVGTSQQGSNNNYTYFKIWSGSLTINAGDKLVFTSWISSSSPKVTGSVDLVFTDGTATKNMNVFDQNGLHCDPATDLSGYGADVWYTRTIGLSPDANGKTTSYLSIAQEGDSNGTYTFYVRDIKIVDSTGTLRTQIMSGGTPAQTPTQLSDIGFSNVTLKTVSCFMDSGTRVSPSRSIVAAGIVRSSIVSWTQAVNGAVVANAAQGPNKINYTTVESSLDGGATWQTCTNHQPVPNLYPGLNTTGVSVLFRQTIRVAGPDPTVPVTLNDFTFTTQPSYLTTVNNVKNTYSSANWGTAGTYSNTQTGTVGALNLNGVYRNWATDANPLNNITLWGLNPTMVISQPNSCLQIRCDAQGDIRAELLDVGSWTNFTLEVDVYLPDAVGNYGVVYRGVGNNTNNSFAYNAYIDGSGVHLAYAGTQIVGSAITLTTGQWYHLKVQVSGSNHKLWLNDVLYINQNDTNATGSGSVGLRHYNSNAVGGSSTRHSGFFQNFGIIQSQTGTWVSNGVSLASLTTFGPSLIQWNDSTPTNATLLIEASTDNGTTYATCTNNAAIPGITPGASASGKTLKIRASLSAQNANVTPNLLGLSTWVSSVFSASGSRISPALSLNNVGVAGSTSISWNAIVPANTSLLIDTSLDGSAWTNVGSGAQGSASIAGITAQGSVIDDTFDSDTHTSYSSTAITGGTPATWTWDTIHSRLVGSGGTNDILAYNALSVSDVQVQVAMDIGQNAGLIVRMVDSSNLYLLYIEDSTFGNTCTLWKVVAGTFTQIGSAAFTFVSGTPHMFQLSAVGTTISVSMDGMQLISVTDAGVAGPGKVGLHAGTQGRFYNFRVQPLGQSVSGLLVYSRARLSSTDPTVSPQIEDITVSVRGPNIQTGSLIPQTQYSVLAGSKNTIAADFDDLAKQSNYVWRIDKNKQFSFLPRTGQPSPWIACGADMLVANLNLVIGSDQYRNTQIIIGGKDVNAISEQKQPDGITQSWTLSYPVDSITSITIGGVVQTFGVKGVDTNRSFYYEKGSNVLSQDADLTPLDATQIIAISYQGQVDVTVEVRNDMQISWLAGTDGTDGIVAMVEDCGGLNKLAMLQLGYARLQQYAIMTQTLTFTTLRDGLAPGQVFSAFLPQFGLNDWQALISGISTTWITTSANNVITQQPFYAVTATSGPIIPTYTRFLTGLAQQ